MQQSPRRHDGYAFIHKALRAFMSHVLVRVGRLDADDPAEVAEVSEALHGLIAICRMHLKHENEVIHPAMEARAPGSAAEAVEDHVHHVGALASLEALVGRLPGDAQAAQALYHALGIFVAENFEHMQHEETAHNAVLWATHSDDELRALEQRIVSAIPPAELNEALRWMLPHLTPAERAEMLGGMRANAPFEVFQGVLGMIRPLLGGRDWRKLAVALGL